MTRPYFAITGPELQSALQAEFPPQTTPYEVEIIEKLSKNPNIRITSKFHLVCPRCHRDFEKWIGVPWARTVVYCGDCSILASMKRVELSESCYDELNSNLEEKNKWWSPGCRTPNITLSIADNKEHRTMVTFIRRQVRK